MVISGRYTAITLIYHVVNQLPPTLNILGLVILGLALVVSFHLQLILSYTKSTLLTRLPRLN